MLSCVYMHLLGVFLSLFSVWMSVRIYPSIYVSAFYPLHLCVFLGGSICVFLFTRVCKCKQQTTKGSRCRWNRFPPAGGRPREINQADDISLDKRRVGRASQYFPPYHWVWQELRPVLKMRCDKGTAGHPQNFSLLTRLLTPSGPMCDSQPSAILSSPALWMPWVYQGISSLSATA